MIELPICKVHNCNYKLSRDDQHFCKNHRAQWRKYCEISSLNRAFLNASINNKPDILADIKLIFEEFLTGRNFHDEEVNNYNNLINNIRNKQQPKTQNNTQKNRGKKE
jgi:hypothetical protein